MVVMMSIKAAFFLSFLVTSSFETVDTRRLIRDKLKQTKRRPGIDETHTHNQATVVPGAIDMEESAVTAVYKQAQSCFAHGKYNDAFELCEKVLKLKPNHVDAQHFSGEMLREGKGCQKDVARALRLWESSSAGGSALAAYNLGCAYSEGHDVQQDSTKAVSFFKAAAARGDASAAYNLGQFYNKGNGVKQDFSKAARYYALGVENAQEGDTQASRDGAYNLSILYASGDGVPQSDTKAFEYALQSALQGLAEAMFNVGRSYKDGTGTAQDLFEARKFFAKAAEGGQIDAVCELGAMYFRGEGGKKDVEKGLRLMDSAAAQGNIPAQTGLDNLKALVDDDFPVFFVDGAKGVTYILQRLELKELATSWARGELSQHDYEKAAEAMLRRMVSESDGDLRLEDYSNASTSQRSLPSSSATQQAGESGIVTMLAVGARIELFGLRARPELNGREGKIVQYVLDKKRWEVLLSGDLAKNTLTVKADNLRVLTQPESTSDEGTAPFQGPPDSNAKFSVVSVPGKGTGVIALLAISKGELVLAEKPLFTLSGKETTIAMRAGRKEALVTSQVQRLRKNEQDAFWVLYDRQASEGQKTALGIWDTNAIGHGEWSLSNTEGLYAVGSRFNHNCVPNVIRVWKEGKGVEEFRAARDISPEEELTICYGHVFDGRSKRQAELKRAFGFTCQCKVCCLTGKTQKKSDALREEYRKVNGKLPQMGGNCREALKLVKRQIEIIELEFAGEAWLLKRAYYDGFQFALGTRDLALAKSMITKAIACKIVCEGDAIDGEMRLWSIYVADPCSHPIAKQLGLNDKTVPKVKGKPNDPCRCGSGKKYKKCCGV